MCIGNNVKIEAYAVIKEGVTIGNNCVIMAGAIIGYSACLDGNGHTSLYADLIDAIQNNREPYIDAVAGRNALELVLAIYKSQRDGKPVRLPLKEFGTLEMSGEFEKGMV